MFVYHICRKDHKYNYDEGYIGVSDHIEKRWDDHRKGKTNEHLKNAYNKYDDILEYTIFEGNKTMCLRIEEYWRPERKMGWNIAPGGGMPPGPNNPATMLGRKHTEETKRKMSESRSGVKHPMYGKTFSEDARKNMSNAHKGYKVLEETKRKISNTRSNMTLTDNHKKKLSISKMGLNNPMYGKPKSDEAKRKLSEARTGVIQKKVKCPHCDKIGGLSGMTRYHFDNCKFK